jgi:hypothetical protein
MHTLSQPCHVELSHFMSANPERASTTFMIQLVYFTTGTGITLICRSAFQPFWPDAALFMPRLRTALSFFSLPQLLLLRIPFFE